MKKLCTAIFFSFTLIAAQHSLAMPPKPAKCPGVSALQTTVFEEAEQDEEGVWEAGVMHNRYDTEEAWTFLLRNIYANGRQDALNRAARSLKTLKFQSGPAPLEEFGMWICDYITAEGYAGVAVTPAFDMNAAKSIR